MMGAAQSIPELVAATQANAKSSEKRLREILKLTGGQNETDAQVEERRAETNSIELAAVDIFSVFEARMQHHFRRGPFSRKLKSLLLEAGQTDLAERLHQYYLAVNVLKHGKGASYRELLNAPNSPIVLRPSDDIIATDAHASAGLVDVSASGFIDGLATTILEAYHFLENR